MLLGVVSAHAQIVSLSGTTSQYTGSNSFKFQGDGTIVAIGTYSGATATFSDTTDNGTAVKMVWYPEKASFRAGKIDTATNAPTAVPPLPIFTGVEWDDVNTGVASVAFGDDTVASGNYSTATGYLSVANGSYSVAMGNTSLATGSSAIAAGSSTVAGGTSSTAFGSGSSAIGSYSVALGLSNTANGYASAALGRNSTTSGTCGIALGYFSTAPAYDVVLGKYNLALNADGMTAASLTSWASTDPAFEIGNGTSSTQTSDALVVYKNGNAAFQGTVSIAPGGDIPMYSGQ